MVNTAIYLRQHKTYFKSAHIIIALNWFKYNRFCVKQYWFEGKINEFFSAVMEDVS